MKALLDWLEGLYKDNVLELDGKSCETISDELRAFIAARYLDREIWIEISEDGECGSFTRYDAVELRK